MKASSAGSHADSSRVGVRSKKVSDMIKSRILSSKANRVFAGRQAKQSYGPTPE